MGNAHPDPSPPRHREGPFHKTCWRRLVAQSVIAAIAFSRNSPIARERKTGKCGPPWGCNRPPFFSVFPPPLAQTTAFSDGSRDAVSNHGLEVLQRQNLHHVPRRLGLEHHPLARERVEPLASLGGRLADDLDLHQAGN